MALVLLVGLVPVFPPLPRSGGEKGKSVGPTSAEPDCPWEIESARPRPDLTRLFTRSEGWTGSDGAYSIPLGPDRTLWLFGDTFIGRVVDGKRVGARMVNNTAA